MFDVHGLQLVLIERGIVLHRVSKCRSVHIFAGHWILGTAEPMERRKLFDLELLVVGEWD